MVLVMTLISVLLVVSVVGTAIWKEKALPDSISALVYALPSKWQWVRPTSSPCDWLRLVIAGMVMGE